MLLMPSVQEGWGIPVLEAAAAGLPAIGTNTTGLRDSIVHGSTGLLVPFGDSPAIADAIIRLAQDSELRRTYGVNARRRARNFDWSLQLPKYSSFLLDEWMHCA
jgi:glycosyltransferase involved in cell wall biosynthesis